MKNIILILLLIISACTPRIPEKFINFDTSDPAAARMLLAEMPKGAELHTHLSGIPYAEDFLKWAAEDKACIEKESGRIVSGPCRNGTIAATELYNDPDMWNVAVNRLSVREWLQDNRMWGHDQFFSTFGKIGVAKLNGGRLLACAVRQAEQDKVQYLELMLSIYGSRRVKPWAKKVGWNGNAEECYDRLKQVGLFHDMEFARKLLDQAEDHKRELIGEGPGRDVEVRYINQVYRGAEPADVFAQMAWSFELVRRDPRVVGLNMVGPEDAPIAVRDYALHMDMLDFFHKKYPDVSVALHAGELTGGLTTPKALSDHIRLAVVKGHAGRIGHGVGLAYENGAAATLKLMRDRNIPLEVLLGSNDIILHVRGEEHPLSVYLNAGVPVVISSDDMGVGRSSLTNEYLRAVVEQGMGYDDLKRAARNSLEFSFLSGKSLWKDAKSFRMIDVCAGNIEVDVECSDFLSGSEKAQQQWKLEQKLRTFEDRYILNSP